MRHLLTAALFALASPAFAHAPAIGPNGGLRLHWGPHHFELKPAGRVVNLYVLTAAADKPVDASKARASGRLLIDGKLVPVTFTPAGGNLLTAPGALTGNWQAQVVIRMPGQQPATLKFSERQRAEVAAAASNPHRHQGNNAHSH
ncbi:MAG: hypothetical protein KGZ61_00300 [Sandarakinorhabdus sp.]|nr:hypothetical protein [Sandarakinorhabdus sp.]